MTPSEIAAGLTWAQCKAILKMECGTLYRSLHIPGVQCRTRQVLEDIGLVEIFLLSEPKSNAKRGVCCTLTPLGVAVREEIAKGGS